MVYKRGVWRSGEPLRRVQQTNCTSRPKTRLAWPDVERGVCRKYCEFCLAAQNLHLALVLLEYLAQRSNVANHYRFAAGVY